MRTADSGYLTRRLVDVAQDVIVREEDCDITTIDLVLERALLVEDPLDALEILNESLMGRVLGADILNPQTGEIALAQDTILDDDGMLKLGEAMTLSGIAQEIVLRGTSLTEPKAANHSWVTETIKLGTRDSAKREAIREGFIHEHAGKELARTIEIGGEPIEVGETLTHELLEVILETDELTELHIRNNNIRGIEVEAITEGSRGVIESLRDRIIGRVLAEDVYDANGKLIGLINETIDEKLADKLCAIREKVMIRSVLTCKSVQGVCKKCYGQDLANKTEVEIGEAVGIIAAQSIGEPGTQLTMRTFHTGGVAGGDITQGLPRVEELFEARKPKNAAIIAEINGEVSNGEPDKNGLRTLVITPQDSENQQSREYSIPFGIQPLVKAGDFIKAGDNITDGAKNPHDILRICGLKETHRYLVKEVQKVYKSQGVEINDKHIEVMVRQMLHKVSAYYEKDIDQTGRNIYNATVIPNRGAWIELETDSSGSIAVRIDRTRKMPLSYFLRALDFESNDEILDLFDVNFFVMAKIHSLETANQIVAFLNSDSAGGADARNSLTVGYISRHGQRNEETFDALLEAFSSIDKKNDRLSNYKYFLEILAKIDEANPLVAGYLALVDMLNDDKHNGEDNQEKALIGIYNRLRPGEPPSAENAASLLQSQFFDPRRYDLASVGRYKITKKLGWKYRVLGKQLAEDLVSIETGEVLIPADTTITQQMLDKIPDEFEVQNFIGWDNLFVGESVYEDFRDPDNGEILFRANEIISMDMIESIPSYKKNKLLRLAANKLRRGYKYPIPIRIKTQFGAYTMLCAPTLSIKENRTICTADIMSAINYVFALMSNSGLPDDIDHLGNRRVRAVGELLQNQFRIGMARMERVVRERMTTQDAEIVTPQNLINIRPVVAAIKEFFGSSQLSQFMDQHNPLSELTHKRRLSALGPGGLSRERAGFEVRDVHNSHYGRMCPIETPEGPNIGLIGSLSNYARVNQYGFMETPYRKVIRELGKQGSREVGEQGIRELGKKGIRESGKCFVSNEVRYMTADEEETLTIAQANEPLDENDWFVNERVVARHNQETSRVSRDKVDYMDVSPKQVVSIATALIPFLENDDANRALMGANMQRQAVPLLKTQAPLVGTGMEFKAACDSGVMVLAKRPGTVVAVDSQSIKIRVNDKFVNSNKDKYDVYNLQKFVRSNQGTCINQIPIVEEGEKVFARQPIADGPATSNGELALGYNIIVAYMPWEGYNYEDAILLNENLIKRDIYTSIHIEEYQCDARDTKLGPEEVTRDIPNVSEDILTNLDADGIIAIGADVRTGDILVGKVTPKGETELTAEERLLRAIFGEKAREVRDTSLRVPHGESGKVVAVNVFTRDNNDEMAPGVNKQVRVYIAQKRKISVGDKMSGRHGNKGVVSEIRRQEDMPFLPDGTPVDIVLNPLGVPSRMNIGQVLETHLGMAVRKIGLRILSNDKNIANDLRKFGFDVDTLGLPVPSEAGLHIATPVFDGAREADIADTIKLAGLDEDGKTLLFDGRTGEPFENRVTVGCVYMLKLHHLVDDKIHARSTGPYSLVTQQPLGGKAQFGGQRFGEMEVWALEAYGASYTLQEILTVKSDDVVGRVKAYEAIVKGQNIPEPGVPESFKVLIKELQSIGLDIRVLSGAGKEIFIHDDDDDDDKAVRKKADDMGVDVGSYGDHDVKPPEPEDLIADDSMLDSDLDPDPDAHSSNTAIPDTILDEEDN